LQAELAALVLERGAARVVFNLVHSEPSRYGPADDGAFVRRLAPWRFWMFSFPERALILSKANFLTGTVAAAPAAPAATAVRFSLLNKFPSFILFFQS
jgi:hypothetical protein